MGKRINGAFQVPVTGTLRSASRVEVHFAQRTERQNAEAPPRLAAKTGFICKVAKQRDRRKTEEQAPSLHPQDKGEGGWGYL